MRSLCFILILAGIPPGSFQDDPARAQELLSDVASAMKDVEAVSFECRVRLKMQTVEVSQGVKVILERPNRARLEISGGGQDALIMLDGSTQWHYLKARNRFVKSRQLGTTKIEQYGTGPLATLFFEKGTGPLHPYLSAATVTRENLGKEECAVVAWKVGAEETRLWISGKSLRQCRITRSIAGEKVEQTLEYGEVDSHPRIAGDAFTFTPPEQARPLDKSGEAGLLAVGADAPDFIATDLQGKERRLSDFKGRPVIVNFWFYG
jgi:outer membrane lipoprotein-sorting protein